MATIAKVAVMGAKTLHGGPILIVNHPEAASQSFKAGEAVYLVNGLVTVCSADPGVILGFALHDASGVTNTNVQVELATPSILFTGNRNASVTARSDIGKAYGITATSNKWHVDATKVGTTARVLIHELDTRDVLGDTYGRLLFSVLAKYCQMAVTS